MARVTFISSLSHKEVSKLAWMRKYIEELDLSVEEIAVDTAKHGTVTVGGKEFDADEALAVMREAARIANIANKKTYYKMVDDVEHAGRRRRILLAFGIGFAIFASAIQIYLAVTGPRTP